MKIAFWSNVRELHPVSANMAAISVAIAIRYPCTIVTMENRLCHHSLGKAYHGGVRADLLAEPGNNYYDGNGMEGLLRKIYRGEFHNVVLRSYLQEIIKDRLYYIPQSRAINNDIFDYEFDRCVGPLFHMISKNADLCIIDTASNNLSTKTILEEADLIVINLSQKQDILKEFFHNYSSLISKAIFIINDYDPRCIPNFKQISRQYQVPVENIIAMPACEMYRNAYLRGDVYQFISRNLFCLRDDPNYIFLQAVRKAAMLITKRAELHSKEMNSCGS